MNLRNLFRVSAALFAITGLVWLLAPSAMPTSLGVELDPYGEYYLRLLGGFNISLAVLAFLVSGLESSPARQAVATTLMLQQLLSGIVNLLAVLGGVVPGAGGWFGVAFNLVFAVAFGYFRFLRPEPSLTPGLQT